MNPFFDLSIFFKWVDWFNHQLYTVVKTWGSCWCVCVFVFWSPDIKTKNCLIAAANFWWSFPNRNAGFVYLKVTLWVGSNVGSTKISSRSEKLPRVARVAAAELIVYKWTGRLEDRWKMILQLTSCQAVSQHDCFIASF